MPLQAFTVRAPGFYGLNTQAEVQTDSFDWASVADNCVYDDLGRLVSRKGWTKLTTTALAGTPDIKQVFEYKVDATTTKIISAAGNKLYSGTATLTDLTGTLTPTGDNWNFQNFNGKVVGWQQGHTPIRYNNAGDFENIPQTSGTLPDGPACLSAFGRMWAFDDDRTTLRFSALLDETRWATADGGGSVDLRSNKAAVHSGLDFGVALAEAAGYLVVFMTNTVLVYSGATDPSTMTLTDVLAGVGCAARDSVQNIGDEVLFLAKSGLVGLRRALESSDNMPMAHYTTLVRDRFLTEILAVGVGDVRSAYHRRDALYLISNNTFTWCLNTQQKLEDGTYRVTRWDSIKPKSMYYASDGELYIGKEGVIGKYSGYKDNTASYVMDFTSTWTHLGSEQLKFPKKLEVILIHSSSYNHTLKIGFDYLANTYSVAATSGSSTGNAEWGEGEWGISQWGGAQNINIVKVNLARSGQILQLGFKVGINGSSVALQQMKLFTQLGRLSR